MLDRALLGDAYRSDLADAAKVVAHEVDDHVQFRSIFGARAQFLGILPCWAGALHRSRRDAAGFAVNGEEEFGAQRQQ